MWHAKWSLCIICIIKNTSVDYIQPETPTQTHTRLPQGTRQPVLMLTLSPSDFARRWVFYIWLKQILPVLLWRVLHLVKSHYYGNVRVLEIMARWEQLDCLWHNSPSLSISSASSLLLSLYCMLPPLTLLYTSQFPFLTHLSCSSQNSFFLVVVFFFHKYLLAAKPFCHLNQTLLYESVAVATFQPCLRDCLSSAALYLRLLSEIIWHLASSVAVKPKRYLWHEELTEFVPGEIAAEENRGSAPRWGRGCTSHWQQIFQVTSTEKSGGNRDDDR